jgi:hypothetical protein
MAGVITTGNHPKALWPGVHAWWGQKYNEHPTEYTDIFDVKTSTKNYEEDVEETGFGLVPAKPQGEATTYDSHAQGPTTRYAHVAYSSGFIVTREEMDDNLYKDKAFKRSAALAFSFRQTKEIIAANVLNRAFNSSFTGGDGLELCSTAHVTLDGTQSNELATPADFSEAALEDLLVQIMNAKNTRGLRIGLMGRKLIVPPALVFECQRVLKSTLRSDTANNDINAVRSMGLLPDGVCVNHYLTDTNAWFVKTNAPDALNLFQRIGIEFRKDNDFDTDNAKAKGYERWSTGWSDFRGVFASAGSS